MMMAAGFAALAQAVGFAALAQAVGFAALARAAALQVVAPFVCRALVADRAPRGSDLAALRDASGLRRRRWRSGAGAALSTSLDASERAHLPARGRCRPPGARRDSGGCAEP
jgi:hypothetical protein